MTDHDEFLDELRRRADRAHNRTPAASAPPGQTWQCVMAAVQPKQLEKGEPEMTTFTALAVPIMSRPKSRGIAHFANIAASVLVIAALALSAWFAAMNLLPANDGNNGIAFAPSTPIAGDAACDVVPLTVDEVMQIVKNPYAYEADHLAPGVTLNPTFAAYDAGLDLTEGNALPSERYFYSANRQVPSEDVFASASEATNRYLACLPTATYGQFWAMIAPVSVQMMVLDRFPVFADEATVRTYVETTVDQQVISADSTSGLASNLLSDYLFVVNPEIDQAASVLTGEGTYTSVVAMGVEVTDSDGSIVLLTDSEGRSQVLHSAAGSLRPVIVVGLSPLTGQWYVLTWLSSM